MIVPRFRPDTELRRPSGAAARAVGTVERGQSLMAASAAGRTSGLTVR